MSTIAQSTRTARSRTKATAAARRRPRSLGGGILWIVLFAGLLAGVVAVNVTVLRLNLELDRSARESSELKAEIAGLRSQVSSASATARIERLARTELGLVQADSETYVRLER